jgi:hypothetical protein
VARKQRQEGRGTYTAAALAPQAPWVARLSARSALITDLFMLLGAIEAPLDSEGHRRLVVESNILGRGSESTRKKTWKELKTRFILDRDHELFSAFWKEWMLCSGEQEQKLTAYILLAINDRLVADLGVGWLYPKLLSAPQTLTVDEVLVFIESARSEHPELDGWSEKTMRNVAKHYLASIRDVGLARGIITKTSVRPALYGAPTRLLIRALRLAGLKPQALLRSELFKLLCIGPDERIDAFAALNRRGGLRFQVQGAARETR